jgi:carboxyl-terminal processing protease
MKILLGLLLALPAIAGDNLLENADFAAWKDGVPEGWTMEQGAGMPSGKESSVAKGLDGGVMLSGDASTQVWRVLGQKVTLDRGARYRLTFEARATGLKLEGTQFDNARAWMDMQGGDGKRTSSGGYTAQSLDWAPSFEWTELEMIVMPGSTTAHVRFFLSKTGSIEIRKVSLHRITAPDSTAILLKQVGLFYSYLDHKRLDWKVIAERHRAALEAAEDPESFAGRAKELMAELKDPHVVVQAPGGVTLETFERTWKRDFNYKYVARQMKDVVQIGKIAFAGRTLDGFGFIAVGSLVLSEEEAGQIVAEIEARMDAPGFILDVRGNTGGNEAWAQKFAAHFADRERVYARHRFRNGPSAANFGPWQDRRLVPREGKTFTKPVVVLIGPGCISSGEGFVKAMKCLPHVTLVGKPTAGASGNPSTLDLPNGVGVRFSRWVDAFPDGTPTEGVGVPPDVDVTQAGDHDPTLEKAEEILREKTKK